MAKEIPRASSVQVSTSDLHSALKMTSLNTRNNERSIEPPQSSYIEHQRVNKFKFSKFSKDSTSRHLTSSMELLKHYAKYGPKLHDSFRSDGSQHKYTLRVSSQTKRERTKSREAS